jgi:hypothetical protein
MHLWRFLLIVAVVEIGCDWTMRSALAADPLPKFTEVEAAVRDGLSREKGYAPNDLLSRKQVKTVLDAVEGLGWELADRGAVERRTLDDGAFLVEKLRTSDGLKFMRKVASLPMIYDRLDRMAQLPQGRSTIERLINGPDGHKLLEYMTNEKGGRELAKMLSKDGRGDFNKPTGKLYTAEHLLVELKKLHSEALSVGKQAARR